ncbi:MAG: DUF3102 domain-containing protein [Spirochaetota bacterium]|nr:DUF3102 domain-containing protein [Spirochaetota bacterium]
MDTPKNWLLTEQKAELAHGEFLPWLKENVPFSEDTAERYIQLFAYRDKTASVADLQDAYKKIEEIETAEKQSEAL